ncbi:hypothetical protein HDU97_000954 [Phlyctochytrium planicorne]|nr:hypothetical protein HDU97_000954 [Phlyctochytrium planicorne]
MPLYNKKPIDPAPPVSANLVYSNPDTEVFFIPFTGEIFLTYDDFIGRYTLYNKKVWSCEVTGKTGLTYKEAMQCEQSARKKFDSKFPEVWRKAALQKIHWSTQPLAALYDQLHDYFKDHIFMGELVGIEIGPEEYNAVVVEIIVNPNTDQQISYNSNTCPIEPPAMQGCEYVVHLSTGDGVLLDDTDPSCPVLFRYPANLIRRNRRAMSKLNFKTFIRDSAVRETWIGAPWVVKSDLVRRYNLSVSPPDSLMLSTEEKKKRMKAFEGSDLNSDVIQFPMEDLDLPTKAPRPKVDESGVPYQDRPVASFDFTGIPPALTSSYIQSWYFMGIFGKPISLFPATLEDFGKAIRHRSLSPRCTLVNELFGCLMNIVCRYWATGTEGSFMRALYPIHEAKSSDTVHSQKFYEYLATISDDERVAIDQWYKWYTGRWNNEGDAKGRTKDTSLRLKAWEVALIGFLRDIVPEQEFPQKWKVLCLLIGAPTDDEFFIKGEIEPSEPSLNGDVAASPPASIEPESDHEPVGRRSLRKRKRVITYSSDEEDAVPVSKGIRSSSRIKAIASSAEAPVEEEKSDPVAKPRGRPRSKQIFEIENLINIASKRFILLETADKIMILHAMIQFGAVHSNVVRDYMDDAVDKLTERRKERREMTRDQRAVYVAFRGIISMDNIHDSDNLRAELDQKEKEKAAEEETNGHHDDSNDHGENGHENGNENGGMDVEDYSRLSSRVMKLKAEQARREEEERRRKGEAEKARKEHKEKQKELRKAQEERKKVDDSERTLLRRQVLADLDLRMMSGVSRILPLGSDRFFNRYWWFDGPLGAIVPEAEALEKLAKKGSVKATGPLECPSGFLFVEEFDFRQEDRIKFLEGKIPAGKWGYYSDPSQLQQLLSWLDPRGMREMELLSSLNHVSESILLGMRKRTEEYEKSLEAATVRRSSRRGDDDGGGPSYLRYTNDFADNSLYKKGGLLV